MQADLGLRFPHGLQDSFCMAGYFIYCVPIFSIGFIIFQNVSSGLIQTQTCIYLTVPSWFIQKTYLFMLSAFLFCKVSFLSNLTDFFNEYYRRSYVTAVSHMTPHATHIRVLVFDLSPFCILIYMF